jgi:hypothetical protein
MGLNKFKRTPFVVYYARRDVFRYQQDETG